MIEEINIINIYKDEESGIFVSKCTLPPLYSQGRTKTEALIAIESATKLFIKQLFNKD